MTSQQPYNPQNDEQVITDAYKVLLDSYLNSNHRRKVEIIEKAYNFAREAHKGVRRRSGEPYILHPIAVATIVSVEMGLGSTSICSALLHDVVEDTDYTVEDIRHLFGDKIAEIVDGLTKISGGIFGDGASAQAENFRKLLLTMGNDIRVVLIKMADRLHNMRTLQSMPPAKQYKIAGETLYIYAPLAHRLGLFAIKTELEDLSFKYNHPETFETLKRKIATSEASRNTFFEEFAAPIRERLDRMGLQYEFKARVKSCYSIWKKMETKHVPFEEVYDLYAARIVFECDDESIEKRRCMDIYSEITDLYKLHPSRTRDWLSTPKPNGYRALHITVMGPHGTWVEVQIRSRRMDDIAERGLAAHWKYKIGEDEDSGLTAWLRTIQDILKQPGPTAMDMLDTIKLDLFSNAIVVFSPKGDLFNMPPGATVLDFAFTLHSELGAHCIAGKVNRQLVPLSQQLASGDQVEVLTSRSQVPQPEWESMLVTAVGQARLRQALRHSRRQVVHRGEEMYNRFLADNNIEPSNDAMIKVIALYHAANKDDLYRIIGSGEVVLGELTLQRLRRKKNGTLLGFLRDKLRLKAADTAPAEQPAADGKVDLKKVYDLRLVDGKPNYELSDCCKPIPGDDVVGFVIDGNRVVVHKMDCPRVARLKATHGPLLVQTRWDETTTVRLPASVRVEGIDRQGVLLEIISVISTTMVLDMRRLNIEAYDGVFHCDLDVLIADATILTDMCRRLRSIKGVNMAARVS